MILTKQCLQAKGDSTGPPKRTEPVKADVPVKKIEETKKEPVTRKVVDLKKQEDKLVPPGTGVFCYFSKGIKIVALNVNNKCIVTGIFYQIYLFLDDLWYWYEIYSSISSFLIYSSKALQTNRNIKKLQLKISNV